MAKNILKMLALAVITLLALLMAVSCAPQKKPIPDENPNRPDLTQRDIQDGNRDPRDTRSVDPMDPNNGRNDNVIRNDLAEEIARKATEVKGVDRAYVVVMGNTALIGVNLVNKDDAQARTVKERVANSVEDRTRIVRAYVTSDPDLVTRIQKIADGIAEGRPITEFFDEIGEILNKLKPESSQ